MEVTTTRLIDARGSFCPGPLMEVIRAIKAGQVGDVIAVYSSDSGSRTDIPLWAGMAGQEFIDIINHDGYDEIRVRKIK